jgi:hypothetical protein
MHGKGEHRRASLRYVAYSLSDARQELLEALAEAIESLSFALACLGEAYDKLDETSGERLEEAIFRPVQVAYGRAQRTYTGFAQRHGIQVRSIEEASAGVSPAGARGFIDLALGAVAEAELTLSTLQDSMLPVEAGDEELRAGLAGVRDRIAGVSGDAREFTRTLGR